MSMIVIGSVKASPGVTTATLALGAMWPQGRTALIVELDRAGGDIAARFGLPSEPGLVSLAAATRHKPDSDGLVWQHAQQLPGGLPVLIAPPSGARTRAAMAMLQPRLFADLPDVDVLADLGRVELDDAAATSLVAAADLVVIAVRPVLAELHHLAATAPTIRACNANITVLICGRGSYGRDDVEHGLGIDVIGILPHDIDGAEALAGTPTSTPGFSRLPLLRSARTLAEGIAGRLHGAETSSADEVDAESPVAEAVA